MLSTKSLPVMETLPHTWFFIITPRTAHMKRTLRDAAAAVGNNEKKFLYMNHEVSRYDVAPLSPAKLLKPNYSSRQHKRTAHRAISVSSRGHRCASMSLAQVDNFHRDTPPEKYENLSSNQLTSEPLYLSRGYRCMPL